MVPLPDAKTPIRIAGSTYPARPGSIRVDPGSGRVPAHDPAAVEHCPLPGEDRCSPRSRAPSSRSSPAGVALIVGSFAPFYTFRSGVSVERLGLSSV